MGAYVVKELFIDAGASGTNIDRPALQKMLNYITENPVDYVVVHKVDRLARNRADDSTIATAISAAGAELVSASESIDGCPSGELVHGIMASIAEFYSRNLSNEALKGMSQKHREGGNLERIRLREDVHSNFKTATPEQRREMHWDLFGAIRLIRTEHRTIRLVPIGCGKTLQVNSSLVCLGVEG